ncbi:hypothetical protein [Roseateles saccharophilus]|uniref:hypothetical protein n=1 Tax=Roseateles saccharophilus TaxID=304 RepID=UPI002407FD3D|nr:hypothetical protein [Roseateles saccharophilus]MDG0834617.1 hypothetical protein [Roseateles saccharophilus]
MTKTAPPPSSDGVPLPRLSDEAAVELYLFVEHLFLLIEARYGGQIRRHFDDRDRHNLIGPDFERPMDDPPF